MAGVARWQVRAVLALFIVSGFSGLIYQSIWSHYLGLTLGHAAYAQTLVLAIFMGGMALGAWWASRRSLHWRNLLKAYALAELAIGIAGLGFHPVFLAYSGMSQEGILPQLPAALVPLYQWTSAALLILPQCVLLGMTFPLLSVGLIRALPAQHGETLGGLYFSNSIGAAFGALAATFLLLPAMGMPGAMAVAGLLNVVVAACAYLLSRGGLGQAGGSVVAIGAEALPAGGTVPASRLPVWLLWAAAITGATSFVYEVVWIRMLNQALGTTLHSFELMLAAFILGLALGGLWIRHKAARIVDAVRYAGYAQVLMGVAAFASAPAFAQSFAWVGWLQGLLERNDQGYFLFNLGSAAIALAVMFPAAFFAGMTLPLFTMALLRAGQGERSVGRVYAANTIGAIAGVALAVHVLIPAIGLHLSLVLAALGDAVLGLVLLRYVAQPLPGQVLLRPLLATMAMLAVALQFGRADPVAQASGVFRSGRLLDAEKFQVLYLRDGKTATVGVMNAIGSSGLSILTNGKPDASINVDDAEGPTGDEITMIMAAALPLAIHPKPERVGVIGWGSGMTTHTLAGSSAVREVDTVEIEAAMVEGARLFGHRVERAYRDPRSRVVIEDARTYFSRQSRKYDVIISEPSNPWVSGVASLFTEEFYRFLANHLDDGGLLVQWLHLYEINDALLAKMVAALLSEFPEAELYLTNGGDFLVVASRQPIPDLDVGRLRDENLAGDLRRVGLVSSDDFRMRRIGDDDLLRVYTTLLGAKGHSDFYPEVALNAPRSRFKQDSASLLPNLVDSGLPILDMLAARQPPGQAAEITAEPWSRFGKARASAIRLASAIKGVADPKLLKSSDALQAADVERLRALSAGAVATADAGEWSLLVAAAASGSLGLLPPEDLHGVWIAPVWLGPEQPEWVNAVLGAYAAAARRDPARMRASAVAALQQEQAALADPMREQLLLIAMLGAAGEGDFAGALDIERRLGPGVTLTRNGVAILTFLLAWSSLQG